VHGFGQLAHRAAEPFVSEDLAFDRVDICLLAGATGMAWAGFAIVNIAGTLVRVLGVRLIGAAFSDPILAFNAWISRNRLVLTAITIAITFVLVARSARRGRDPVESPEELAAELDGMYKDTVAKNVLGTELEPCGFDPLTGFYRDGCCSTGGDDVGVHVVCAQMTAEFLAFSQAQGNDLSTAVPDAGFPGLQPGDRWCLCASRWQEALEEGVAPPVYLDATHIQALEWCSLAALRQHAVDEPGRTTP
jgi:uncharacterized protein (DUF2237 family)